MVGLGQSVQPIISFNYGAKQFDRVKKAFQLFLLSSAAFTTVLWALVMLFPGLFVRMFSSDADLFAVAVPALRVYMLSLIHISTIDISNFIDSTTYATSASNDIFVSDGLSVLVDSRINLSGEIFNKVPALSLIHI